MSVNYYLNLSTKALDFIAGFEGFSANWYDCPSGKKTIGFGHVRRDGESIHEPVSHDYAKAMLHRDALLAANAVQHYVTVPLEQWEYDALVSFVYNVGEGALSRSTLLRLLNSGDKIGAAAQFLLWCHSNGKVLEGLARRREAERKLFLTGEYG